MKDTLSKQFNIIIICFCITGATLLLSGCEETNKFRALPDFDGELIDEVLEPEITYNLDEDIKNGLIYADDEGNIVDAKGHILPNYSHIRVLENGALCDLVDEYIYSGYALANDGKIKFDFYFIEDSHTKYYNKEELRDYGYDVWRYGVREIYARYGCVFEENEYQNIFENMAWYQAEIDMADFDTTNMKACERLNVQLLEELISEYEYELEEEKYMLPLVGQYRNEKNDIVFTITEPEAFEEGDMIIKLTIYCGNSMDEFVTSYRCWIYTINPGTICIMEEGMTTISYDARTGEITGDDLTKMASYVDPECSKKIKTYYYTE